MQDVNQSYQETVKAYEEMARQGLLDAFQLHLLVTQAAMMVGLSSIRDELVTLREIQQTEVEQSEDNPFQTLNGSNP
jgi:hypothetical protein